MATIPIYHIGGESAVLGSVPEEQLHDAITSGEYALAKGPVKVLSPEGTEGTIPSEQLKDALQAGYQFITPSMAREAKYGTATQMLKTGAEGVAEGVLGPLAPILSEAVGIDPYESEQRRKTNPVSFGAGQVAGLVSPIGLGGVLTKAGTKAVEAANLTSKVASGSLRGAVETALFQTTDEASKFIRDDPEASAEHAIAAVGLAGLLGGAGGAALGTVSKAFDALASSRATAEIKNFGSRIMQHADNPEPAKLLSQELGGLYAAVSDTGAAMGLKKEEIGKLLQNADSAKINEAATSITSKFEDMITKLKAKPSMEGVAAKLEQDLMELNSTLRQGPAEFYEGLDVLKRKFGKYEFGHAPEFTPGANFKPTAHGFRTELMQLLEDKAVWGAAGERQAAMNKAYSKLMTPLKEFEGLATTTLNGEKIIDPAKLETYLRSIDSGKGSIKQSKVGNFIDAAQKFVTELNKTHSNLGIKEIDAPGLMSAMESLKTKTAGATAADAFLRHGLLGNAGSGIGAAVGAAVGGGWGAALGAHLGNMTVGKALEKILPAIIKPFMQKEASGTGLKAAAELGAAILKGQQRVNNAAKNVLAGAAEPHPVSDKAIEKLKDNVLEFKQKPEMLLQKQPRDVAHYMPEHETALSAAEARMMTYLAALAPDTSPKQPLDAPKKVSAVQQGRYDAALEIAQNPVSVLGSVKRGTLTQQHITDLQQMYPALYGQMKTALVAQVADHVADGKQVAYKQRLSISKFIGQPLDSTLTGPFIIASQPVPQKEAAPRPASMDKLMHQAKNDMTPSQSRAAAKLQ